MIFLQKHHVPGGGRPLPELEALAGLEGALKIDAHRPEAEIEKVRKAVEDSSTSEQEHLGLEKHGEIMENLEKHDETWPFPSDFARISRPSLASVLEERTEEDPNPPRGFAATDRGHSSARGGEGEMPR